MSIELVRSNAVHHRGIDHALRWLIHPVTVAAAAVLIINDHVLKGWFYGPLTGKLSDIAGLVLAPAVLCLVITLCRSRTPPRTAAALAVAATAAGFVAVKTTEQAAMFASQAWTAVAGPSLVLRDPTDLVALPALALAYWTARRTRDGARIRPRAGDVLRVTGGAALATFAVTATSLSEGPDYVSDVTSWRAQVVAQISGAGFAASKDGLGGWRWLSDQEVMAFRREVPRAADRPTAECYGADPRQCYRIRDGLGVDESHDGGATWQVGWHISPGRMDYLSRAHDVSTIGYDVPPDDRLTSLAVAVHPVSAGGYVVVVANGVDGLAVRAPDGTWRRTGFDGLAARPAAAGDTETALPRPEAATAEGANIGLERGAAFLIFAFVTVVGFVWSRRAAIPLGLSRPQLVLIGGTVLAGLALVSFALTLLGDPIVLAGITRFIALATGVGAIVGVLLLVRQAYGPRTPAVAPWSPVAPVVLGASMTAAAYLGPFLGWSAGRPDEYGPALLLSLLLGGVSVTLTFMLWRRFIKRPVPEPNRPLR